MNVMMNLRAAVVSPGLPHIGINPRVAPSWITSGGTEDADGDEPATASAPKVPRVKAMEEAHFVAMRAVLGRQQQLSLPKLMDAIVAELPADTRPPTKKVLGLAIREVADWNGKHWVSECASYVRALRSHASTGPQIQRASMNTLFGRVVEGAQHLVLLGLLTSRYIVVARRVFRHAASV